jgi:hypothetical protein
MTKLTMGGVLVSGMGEDSGGKALISGEFFSQSAEFQVNANDCAGMKVKPPFSA